MNIRKGIAELLGSSERYGTVPNIQPAQGVITDSEITAFKEEAGALEKKKEDLQKRRDFEKRAGTITTFAGLAILSLGLYYTFRTDVSNPFITIAISYGAMIIGLGISYLARQGTAVQLEGVEAKRDLLEASTQKGALRAYSLYRQHQQELKRYYNQSLAHGRIIFFVGIGCLVGGFIIVGVTLYILTHNIGASVASQALIGGVGAIGGLLSNFIAVLYLRMFTATTQSLTSQLNQLTSTHHLYFANFLASKIDDTKLRENTLCVMSESIAHVLDSSVAESTNGLHVDKVRNAPTSSVPTESNSHY